MNEMIYHVQPWLSNNEIEFKTTEVLGFESLPNTLAGLFEGKNMGKEIIKI